MRRLSHSEQLTKQKAIWNWFGIVNGGDGWIWVQESRGVQVEVTGRRIVGWMDG